VKLALGIHPRPKGGVFCQLHDKKAENVIAFEDFFEDYLDPAMKRWKKAGIV